MPSPWPHFSWPCLQVPDCLSPRLPPLPGTPSPLALAGRESALAHEPGHLSFVPSIHILCQGCQMTSRTPSCLNFKSMIVFSVCPKYCMGHTYTKILFIDGLNSNLAGFYLLNLATLPGPLPWATHSGPRTSEKADSSGTSGDGPGPCSGGHSPPGGSRS